MIHNQPHAFRLTRFSPVHFQTDFHTQIACRCRAFPHRQPDLLQRLLLRDPLVHLKPIRPALDAARPDIRREFSVFDRPRDVPANHVGVCRVEFERRPQSDNLDPGILELLPDRAALITRQIDFDLVRVCRTQLYALHTHLLTQVDDSTDVQVLRDLIRHHSEFQATPFPGLTISVSISVSSTNVEITPPVHTASPLAGCQGGLLVRWEDGLRLSGSYIRSAGDVRAEQTHDGISRSRQEPQDRGHSSKSDCHPGTVLSRLS